jgi:Domain of Unknown Function (DUF1206)
VGWCVGTVGHVARAVVFGLIGVFVIKAALEYNPKEAIGLDGALQKLASAPYGPYLLGLTAAGLIAYGVYLPRRRALPRRIRRLVCAVAFAALPRRRAVLRRAARPAHHNAVFFDDIARICVAILVALETTTRIALDV